MNIINYKKIFVSFIFIFSILTNQFNFAQTGTSNNDAFLGYDSEYIQSFSMPGSNKENWHKFKVVNNVRKVLTVTTTDVNSLNRIESVKLYKGSANSLQFIMDSYPIQSADSVVTVFLDTNVVSINDTIYFRLIRKEKTNCSTCINNDVVNYRVMISAQSLCYSAKVNLDAHFPFDGYNCIISSGQIASACTLKVCAGEQLCLRVSFFKGGVFPMCSTGNVTIPLAAVSSPISSSTIIENGSYISNYCFTSSTTPGIYQVNLTWRYYNSGYDCSNSEPPAEPPFPWWNCSGSFYLQVGPPAPLNLGFNISPNPVCKGSSACLTANQANINGYTYLFETGSNSIATILNSTGNICLTYSTAGNIQSSLTVYNGFCPSPKVNQNITVLNPSLTGSVVKNSCRNYTLTANPSCLPNDATYLWNVGGVTYYGSPVTVDLPGNSSAFVVSLTASAPTLSPSIVWNSTITNVPTYSATISHSTDGCGNITLTATPSACTPSNTYFTWRHPVTGITHVGNPVTFTHNYTDSFFNVYVGLENTSGSSLISPFLYSVPTSQIPNSINCCNNNSICISNNNGGGSKVLDECEEIVWSSTFTFTNTDTISYKSITVMPNVKIKIGSSANITFVNCSFLFYQGSGFELNRTATALNFNKCYLHGCKQLWEGIKFDVNSISNNVTRVNINFKNSMIEDAVTAFDFSRNLDFVDFTITSSIFNKNIYGIKFVNSRSVGLTGPQNKLNVTNSVFTCKSFTYPAVGVPDIFNGQSSYNNTLANAANATPLTKYNFPYYAKSLQGMSLEGATFGTQFFPATDYILASDNLIYENLVQGIVIKGLNMPNFKGNKFININSTVNGGNHPNIYSTITAAIYFVGQSAYGTTYPYQTNKVGVPTSSFSQRNKFTNCYLGIYAKDEPIDVTNNDFNDCYNGIYITNSAVPSALNGNLNCNIAKNNIKNIKYNAITLDKNISINASVRNNIVNNGLNPNYTSKAVELIEVNNPVSAKYKVNNNSLSSIFNGIHLSNTYNSFINNNYLNIYTKITPPSNGINQPSYNSGIGIVACEAPQVFENEIFNSNTSATWWENGIVSKYSRNADFYCNRIDGFFGSTHTVGECGGTYIFNNDINLSHIAHWMLISNRIGDQQHPMFTSSIQPADNRYFNILNLHSYSQNGTLSGVNNRFYLRNSNSFLLLSNAVDNVFTSSEPVVFFPNSILPYTNYGCVGIEHAFPLNRLISKAREIARDELFPPEKKLERFTTRKQLLSNLKKSNITVTGDSDIDNFPNYIENDAVGKIIKVEQWITETVEFEDSSKFSLIDNELNSLITNDSIELLAKQVLGIYSIYIKNKGVLDSALRTILEPIAALCPYSYGTSVYQARAILFGHSSMKYVNECELYTEPILPVSTNRIANNNNEDAVSVEELNVYPNPNNGDFSVILPEFNSFGILEIYNALGSMVQTLEINPDKSSSQVIEIKNLNTGIYFIILKQNGIVVANKKIISSN